MSVYDLSLDVWEELLNMVDIWHLARLWITGDPRVQRKIVSAKRTNLVLPFGIKWNESDAEADSSAATYRTEWPQLVYNILFPRARTIRTHNMPMVVPTFSGTRRDRRNCQQDQAYENLTSLHVDLMRSGMTFRVPLDVSRMANLTTFRLGDCRAVYESMRMPLSLTDLAAPLQYLVNLSSLKSLTALKTLVPPRANVKKLGRAWPPALTSLDAEWDFIGHDETRLDIATFVKHVPATLTHLSLRSGSSNGSTRLDFEHIIPFHCKSLSSLDADFVRVGFANPSFPPHETPVCANLTAFRCDVLVFSCQNDAEPFLAVTGTATITIKNRGILLWHKSPPFLQRIDAQSLETLILNRSRWQHLASEDDTSSLVDAAKARFASLLGDAALAETYCEALVDAGSVPLASVLRKAGPLCERRMYDALRRWDTRDGNKSMYDTCELTLAESSYEDAAWLMERQIVTRLSIRGTSYAGRITSGAIAANITRLTLHRCMPLDIMFGADTNMPLLAKIKFIANSHEDVVGALYRARKGFPSLTSVSIRSCARDELSRVEDVRMFGEMRLYGFTDSSACKTKVSYRVTEPWFYRWQLEGHVGMNACQAARHREQEALAEK